MLTARAAGLLAGLAAIPLLFYGYQGVLGRDIMWLDVAIFQIAVLLGFWVTWAMLRRRALASPVWQVAGAAVGHDNVVLITLGTGVGGGIIIGGKIYDGMRGAGAELGHTLLVLDGEPCTCGRWGCWEAYSSATALIRQARQAAAEHPESLLAGAEEITG